MINYKDVTIEQMYYFIDADVICDADKKQVIIVERNEDIE